MTNNSYYTVFIAEDEFPARELLVEFVTSNSMLKLAGVARNGEEAVEKLNASPCDILLLDIDLPVYTGIEVLERLDTKPRVIFTTAYEKHAVRAFEIGADDYLIKPFTRQRFASAIERSITAINNSRINSSPAADTGILPVTEKGIHYLVPHEEIVYISASGRNCVIHAADREYETGSTLADITSRLTSNRFIRIHKQYTVNLKHVSHFSYYSGGQYILYLKDDDKTNLPVGKTYVQTLKEMVKLG